VADDAHARFDAREREYTYYIRTRKDPFAIDTAWCYSVPLDVEAMNRAAAYLLEASDFTSFAKLGSDNKTNICRVTKAEWNYVTSGAGALETMGAMNVLGTVGMGALETMSTMDARGTVGTVGTVGMGARGTVGAMDAPVAGETFGTLVFTIRADRFLRNMVRAIVGTLVDVGRGKITPERFAEIVAARDLSLSSAGAPAKGLFLSGIRH
jgi:tRNA pseudouridine38-40 synthase